MGILEKLFGRGDDEGPLPVFVVQPTGEKLCNPCACCGGVTRRVWGLVKRDGAGEAAYFVEWTRGKTATHAAAFDLVLGRWGEDSTAAHRVTVSLRQRLIDGRTSYMVVDATERGAAWPDLSARALRRNEVIGTPVAKRAFQVVDAIWEQEQRLDELKGRLGAVESCALSLDDHPCCFTAPIPAAVHAIEPALRAARTERSSDHYVLDGRRNFILGNVDLPVRGRKQGLRWTLWIELDRDAFARAARTWTTPGRESQAPLPGVLANDVPGYLPCVGLEVALRTQPVGLRPLVDVLGDHPLARDQRQGLDTDRAHELVHKAMS